MERQEAACVALAQFDLADQTISVLLSYLNRPTGQLELQQRRESAATGRCEEGKLPVARLPVGP
jgi:hypothetical protein